MEERLGAIFSSYKGRSEELIPILQDAQGEYGYLSDDVMFEVSKFVGMAESNVYGVASFYAQFRFKPIGKNLLMVCRGTACHVKGAPRILDEISRHLDVEEGETTNDMEHTLETVACIGCCALAPAMVINDTVETKLTAKKIKDLFPKEKTE
jgi:NADH-quinone oxidoreductase subunit E